MQQAIAGRLKQATLPTLAWHTLAMAAGIERPASDHHAAAWIGEMLGEAAIAAGGEQKGKRCDVWKTIRSVVELSDRTSGNDMTAKLLSETLDPRSLTNQMLSNDSGSASNSLRTWMRARHRQVRTIPDLLTFPLRGCVCLFQ